MLKEYLTVAKPASAEFTEKKSRFIAAVAPVQDEGEALEFLGRVRAGHRDARHNVYAYKINDENLIQRFSDDGEPAGTAGMPLIEVVGKFGVTNLVVVVTRYFGGILLGAPGLARAYGKAAVLGIDAAQIIKKILCESFVIELEYNLLGRTQHLLEEKNYSIESIDYSDGVTLRIPVPVDDKASFIRLVEDVSGAKAGIITAGQKYVTKSLKPCQS